jgi:translocation and assembly module TamA
VNAGYTVPDAKDAKSSVTLQMNLQKEDTSSYVSSIAALELDLNRSVGKQSMATPYLRLQLEDYTVGAEDSRARLVLPGFRFSQNLVDNPSRPTRGVRYAFDLRGTSGLLGSTTELLQFIGAGSSILPLPWRLSFQTRVQVGISLLSDPLSELPPSLRFFTGGDQSVRGYEYQSLGPKDDTGEVVGGKHLLVGSVELERALFADWGVSVFYDAGNAFDSFANLRLYEGAGVGLHYYTKVGGLNLSLARQIGVEDPGYRIHFTVGFEL